MQLFIGKIVQYFPHGWPNSQCLAAIITGINEDSSVVDLVTFSESGLQFQKDVTQGTDEGQYDTISLEVN